MVWKIPFGFDFSMIKEIECMGQGQNNSSFHKLRTQYSPFEMYGNNGAGETKQSAVLSLFNDGDT